MPPISNFILNPIKDQGPQQGHAREGKKERELCVVYFAQYPWGLFVYLLAFKDQALPSLGFSRQEHWSGLPFPPPMHESEKWKWSCSVMSDPQQPHGLQPSRLLHPWDFPGKSTGVGCHSLLRRRSTMLAFLVKYHCRYLYTYDCLIFLTQKHSLAWKITLS